MWNRDLYVKIFDTIKKSKKFNGVSISTKEEIYKILSKEINVTVDSLKSWAKPKSNGPKSIDREELERALGLGIGSLVIEEPENITINIELPEITKKALLDSYSIIKNYLRNSDVESEDQFCNMLFEIEKLKIVIPFPIYQKIDTFITEEIAPIVYDRETIFSTCYTNDIGTFDDNGTFCIKSEEGTQKFMLNFMQTIFTIEQTVDKFFINEIQPLFF